MNRRQMQAATVRTIHRGRGYQSSVYEVDWNGQRAAVKDFSAAPALFRIVVCPFLVRREIAALRRLNGTAGVPRLLGQIDRLSFALEFIEGTPFDQLKPGDLARADLEHAQAVIDAVHARGVSHGDLKRRSNLLLTPQHEVYLIDFAAAVIGHRRLHPLANWLQRELEAVDNKSVPRIKKHTAPELLTDADRYALEHPTRLEAWARRWLNR